MYVVRRKHPGAEHELRQACPEERKILKNHCRHSDQCADPVAKSVEQFCQENRRLLDRSGQVVGLDLPRKTAAGSLAPSATLQSVIQHQTFHMRCSGPWPAVLFGK